MLLVKSTEINHKSELNYPDHMSTYIQKEFQYGAKANLLMMGFTGIGTWVLMLN